MATSLRLGFWSVAWVLVTSACASSRAEQKISFTEAFGEDYAASSTPVPLAVAARTDTANAKRPRVATRSLELQAALVAFAARARQHRANTAHGAPMPLLQAANWEQVSAALDHFLERAPEETSSF